MKCCFVLQRSMAMSQCAHCQCHMHELLGQEDNAGCASHSWSSLKWRLVKEGSQVLI